MKIVWIDPVNTDPLYLNVMSACLADVGCEVVVRSNRREAFPPPHRVTWHRFSTLGDLPRSLAGDPRRWLFGALYPLDWLRTVRWLRRRDIRVVVLSGHLRLPGVDTRAHELLTRYGIRTVP